MAERPRPREIGAGDPLAQHGRQKADGTFVFQKELRVWRDPPEKSLSGLDGAFGPPDAAIERLGPNHKPEP